VLERPLRTGGGQIARRVVERHPADVKGEATMKWLRRSVLGVVLLLVVGAAFAWWTARATLPQTDGTVVVGGLGAEVRIERDAHGIPTIRAGSPEGAMFGLGFAHAQDRLWQLETHRRIGSGRLAEAFGPPALETDRFLRALGVRRAAAAQWAKASPEVRKAVEAYTAGVNALLASDTQKRPAEFVVLGLQPAPWTPEDSVAWAIMMAWDLGGNWSTELLRMRLSLKLPVERIDELLPPYPGEKPLATADYAALFRGLKVDGRLGQQALVAAPPSGVEGIGSNNWVVHGSHTTTGKPLLANDPHLKLSAPALWYFARLDAPGLKVAGATMPGLPFVVLGQNERVAWGFTNTGPDVQDLYLERIKPDDAARYQTPDGWAAFESAEEIVKVKGAPDVRVQVRSTRHGPVISDSGVAAGLTGPADKPAFALAMRWTALDADSTTLEAGLALAGARSVDAFIAASARYQAPMQNMVVADADGHIGMVAAGKVPLRKAENDLKGLVPAPGWDARYDWAGFLEPQQTPREVDPSRGWIATANQRIHAPDYPHYLTSEWAVPYRMQRIEQLLAARPTHDLQSLRAIQADQLSLATVRLLPFIRQAKSAHPLAAEAHARLAAFDGTMAGDQPAPLIFWAWARQLTEGVFADDLGAAGWRGSLGSRSYRDALEGVLERNDARWCDDQSTPAVVETCAQQIDSAFTRALDELQAAQGSDVAAWRWDRAHVARSEHRPFSRVKALARWFELRTPVGGDTYTVNVSRVNLRPDPTTQELYLDEHGPSLRALYDLADPTQSRVMHSTGQSGNPFSARYRDFVEPWTRVEYVPLWGAPTVATLRLQPAR
jgi:penicillin amidase